MKIPRDVWLETFNINWESIPVGTALIRHHHNNSVYEKEEERCLFLGITVVTSAVRHRHGYTGMENISDEEDFFLDIPEHWEKYKTLKILNKL